MQDPSAPPREIRAPKAAALVVARIRRAIVTGQLKSGDNLPSESQLLSEFGVSRPTIREAIRILESEGLITIARGARRGARVTEPHAGMVARAAGLVLQSRGTTIRDIYEARMLIEPPAARLAAERRPKMAAMVLRPHVAKEIELSGDMVAVTRAIAEFHGLLMEQCGNETLTVLGLALRGVFERALLTLASHRPRVPDAQVARDLKYGLASHRKLVDLIEAGDGRGAEAHWITHMENAGRVWLKGAGSRGVIDIID